VVARHAFGDLSGSTDVSVGPGKMYLKHVPADGGAPTEWEVHDFKGPGAAMGVFNTEESVRGFALSCMNYALERGLPVFLGTKNTELEHYDGLCQETVRGGLQKTEFPLSLQANGGIKSRALPQGRRARRRCNPLVRRFRRWAGRTLRRRPQVGHGGGRLRSRGPDDSTLLTPDGRIVLTRRRKAR